MLLNVLNGLVLTVKDFTNSQGCSVLHLNTFPPDCKIVDLSFMCFCETKWDIRGLGSVLSFQEKYKVKKKLLLLLLFFIFVFLFYIVRYQKPPSCIGTLICSRYTQTHRFFKARVELELQPFVRSATSIKEHVCAHAARLEHSCSAVGTETRYTR